MNEKKGLKIPAKGFGNAGKIWEMAGKRILGGGWLLILFYYLPDCNGIR